MSGSIFLHWHCPTCGGESLQLFDSQDKADAALVRHNNLWHLGQEDHGSDQDD